jgi:hypothetical protein
MGLKMDEKRCELGRVFYLFSQDLSKVLLLKLNEQKIAKFDAD